jgi:hypothetical protein
VGPRARLLHDLEKKDMSCPYRDSKLRLSSPWPSRYMDSAVTAKVEFNIS